MMLVDVVVGVLFIDDVVGQYWCLLMMRVDVRSTDSMCFRGLN